MSRKKWVSLGLATAIMAGAAGYEALDAYDVVPGPLTIQRTNVPRAATVAGHRYTPATAPASDPALPATVHGAAPTTAQVKAVLDKGLANPALGEHTAATVLDADTGATIYAKNADQATTPASVTKLLTAFAIAHSKLPGHGSLQTRTVLDGTRVALVGGGDMMLAKGNGDASKIVGRAGLTDLADQTAAVLKSRGITHVVVDSNTSSAPGPDKAPGWASDLLDSGFTERITNLGLLDDRADDKTPAAADPTKNATQAFIDALGHRGISASYGRSSTTPVNGPVLGSISSAPVLDVLGVALQDSDNAMVESLARQAAALDGVHGDSGRVAQWVEATARAQGIDLAGVHLVDVCGLSQGTTLPVKVLGQVLARAWSGHDPNYLRVLTRLPVADWNGTLHDRFTQDPAAAGRGVVRAKTGSLAGVSSLAGDLVTQGGHRLVFAVTTNGSFAQGPDAAKAAIDAMISGLVALH